MSQTPTISKKPTVVVRTYAADIERVRNEQTETSATPVIHTSTPVPKIGLHHIDHVPQPKTSDRATTPSKPTLSPVPKSTPITKMTAQRKIKLSVRPPLPKPVIVTPSAPATPVSVPAVSTSETKIPLLPHTPIIQTPVTITSLKPLTQSRSFVTMGDDSTDERAIIITDTKHKRFKAGRSIWHALSAWWNTIIVAKYNSAKDSKALPAASERQSVIKRATTLSGATATARDSELSARVQNRSHTKEPLTSNTETESKSGSVPDPVPDTPGKTPAWTQNTEARYPILTSSSTTTVPKTTTSIPVKVEYKQLTRQISPDVSKPIPHNPVIETSQAPYVPPDSGAGVRQGAVAQKTDTETITSDTSTTSTKQHVPPSSSHLQTLTETAILKLSAAEKQFATNESDTGIFPHTPNQPRIAITSMSPSPTVSVVPTTPDPTPVVPAYTKRQKQTSSHIILWLRELVLQKDTNVLTFAIVGVVLGIGVFVIGVWLLMRAFTG